MRLFLSSVSTYEIGEHSILVSILCAWLWVQEAVLGIGLYVAVMGPVAVIESKLLLYAICLWSEQHWLACERTYWIGDVGVAAFHADDALGVLVLLPLVEWSHAHCHFHASHNRFVISLFKK